MSGGHFDYRQYHIVDIADAIQEEIDRNEMDLSDETLREFMLGVSLLRRSAIYVQRIDWLLSGDDWGRCLSSSIARRTFRTFR